MENEKKNVPASNQYTVIRSQIEQQSNTSNQRVFWLILSQSFFVNAFVLLITAQPPKGKEMIYSTMLTVIPLASILTIIFTSLDIIGSLLYINKLTRHYEKLDINDSKEG